MFSGDFVGVAIFLAALAGASAAVFDQRQSGKTNVRVEVKDAVFVAVGDGEGFGGDYDYTYDYSDLTIKPPKPTPVAAATSAEPPVVQSSPHVPPSNLSQTVGILLDAQNSSIIFPSNKPENGTSDSVKIPLGTYKPDQIPVVVLQESHGARPNKFLPVKTVEKHYLSSSKIRGKTTNGTGAEPEEPPGRICSPGFFLDERNRCRRIRRPTRDRNPSTAGFRYHRRPPTKR